MPSDVIEPPTGAPLADDADHAPGRSPTAPVAPFVPPPGSISGDELTVSLAQARPDPLLGEFVSESSETEPAPPPSPSPSVPPADAPAEVSADARPTPAADALDVVSDAPAIGPGLSSSSFEAVGGLGLTPPSSLQAPAPESVVEDEGDEEEEDDDELDDHPARGTSPGVMLLASYASAVTIGLAWLLWTGRHVRESTEPEISPPADTRPDPGHRAGDARKIVPPPPIPEDRLVALGKTVRVGQIEATPLAVTAGPVTLARSLLTREKKSAGDHALKLRLRLRNVSTDTILAPLDEAFLRDRPRADPDSFIEIPGGTGTPIAMFPLAIESEWSIVGQEFRDLKPGQTLEALVVSTPDAVSKTSSAMTWRVRLRTDLNHTDTLGVRFRAEDVKPEADGRRRQP